MFKIDRTARGDRLEGDTVLTPSDFERGSLTDRLLKLFMPVFDVEER